MSDGEVDLLQLLRPKLEAYREFLQRRADSEWDDKRAYDLTLVLTGDEYAAESAANQVIFARTPLNQ